MKRTALLDVNVLIALFDPDHLHHDSAHDWFPTQRAFGWATCPLTENAVVRILSNPAYGAASFSAQEIARRLAAFCESGHHAFWPDDLSLRDPAAFNLVVGHRQLTDIYLLGLAVAHDGVLASFDRSIPLKGVRGARPAHLVILDA